MKSINFFILVVVLFSVVVATSTTFISAQTTTTETETNVTSTSTTTSIVDTNTTTTTVDPSNTASTTDTTTTTTETPSTTTTTTSSSTLATTLSGFTTSSIIISTITTASILPSISTTTKDMMMNGTTTTSSSSSIMPGTTTTTTAPMTSTETQQQQQTTVAPAATNPSTTVQAGLSSTVPYEGFIATFKPQLNFTSSSSASSSNYTIDQLTAELIRALFSKNAVPDFTNATNYILQLSSSFREDLAGRLNLPPGDIGVDSILADLSDTTGTSFEIKFRVSLVRAKDVLRALNQSVIADKNPSNYSSSSSSSSTNSGSNTNTTTQQPTVRDWEFAMSRTLQNVATLLSNISGSKLSGVDVTVSGMQITLAAPDNFRGTTTAATSHIRNPACFLDDDCPGTIILISSLVSFLAVAIAALRQFYTLRKTWEVETRLTEQFEKEVESRNKIREKALAGMKQEERAVLNQKIQEQDILEETARRHQREMEREMEIVRHQQQQQYQQNPIGQQQYQAPRAAVYQQQQPNGGGGGGMMYDDDDLL